MTTNEIPIKLVDVELGTVTHTTGDRWWYVREVGSDFDERYPTFNSAADILVQRWRIRTERAARAAAQRAVADEIAYADAIEQASQERIAELEHRLAGLEK